MKKNILKLKFNFKIATIKYFIILFIILAQNQAQAQFDSMYEILGEENELFGYSISMSDNGQRIVIGSPLNDMNGTDSGKAEVFDFNGSDWVQVGNDILGEMDGDRLGYNVEISESGDWLIVGAPNVDNISGKFKIFNFDGTDWIEVFNIQTESPNFGKDISISQNGERFTISSNNKVWVYDFNQNDNSLIEVGVPIDAIYVVNTALSFDGERLVFSGFYDIGAGPMTQVFNFDGNNWIKLGNQVQFYQAGGCNADCPMPFPARTDMNDIDPNLVISSSRYPYGGSDYINIKVMKYDSDIDTWINNGSSYFTGVSQITQIESPFMLSDSGNFVLIVNTVSSTLKIFQFSTTYWELISNIPIPEQDFNTNIYQQSFKGLVFSEESNNVGIGLPTYDSVRIYNISSTLSIKDIDLTNNDSNFKIYPNPSKGLIYLDQHFSDDISFIQLYDVNQRLIKTYKNIENGFININNVDNGIYFISVKLKKQDKMIFKKIIIE